ncbi:MAG: 1,6-anhydro-N-acetylmuramyl-L-alanine amidase AmpD [Halieaceae bacterium]|jgi:AmpD protein|nr:1,6-anhydro-N-acetylmuramyl-L-alanine amidase AmpD [Halieaceae bacterium]
MNAVIDESGWHRGARALPSDNYNARPDGCVPGLVVVHNISLPPGRFATGSIEALFCNHLDCSADPSFAGLEELRVSAHFLIDRAGGLTQFVSCNDRAWHAGVSAFAGRANCNDFSIGIELEGTDTTPFEAAQYDALSELLRVLRSRYATLRQAPIVGHSDIAPGRKTDPGPAFSWQRLRAALRAVDQPLR